MSIAVLASSVIVLISAIVSIKTNNETLSSSSLSEETNNYTTLSNPIMLENQTVRERVDETVHFPFVPNMTTLQLDNYTLNREEKPENTSVALSTRMSPAFIAPLFPDNSSNEVVIDSLDRNAEEQDSNTTTSTPPSQTRDSWNAFLQHQRDFWEAKSDTYVILIQASSGTGIFASLLQLGFSWLLICSSAKVRSFASSHVDARKCSEKHDGVRSSSGRFYLQPYIDPESKLW